MANIDTDAPAITFDDVYRLVTAYRVIEIEGAEVNHLNTEEFQGLVRAVDQASATMHGGDYVGALGYLFQSPVHPC